MDLLLLLVVGGLLVCMIWLLIDRYRRRKRGQTAGAARPMVTSG